jgi:hypothetical protein
MKPFELNNSPKIEPGFKIPEGYFENFENKIMNQISEKEVKVISIFQKRKFWYSAVAAVFILGISIPMYLNFTQKNDVITDEFLAYDSTITSDDIAKYLTESDIAELEKTINIYDDQTKNYIEEYID